jgi:hypothetical protein
MDLINELGNELALSFLVEKNLLKKSRRVKFLF